jgi:DNA-binding GntR family transcriptional regulator
MRATLRLHRCGNASRVCPTRQLPVGQSSPFELSSAKGRDRISSDLANLQVSTYKRAAYLAIRDMIVELEIPPGARLVENDLASRLKVSKTPIREAIALLEADGLVDIAPYRGATVKWLSTQEMEEQRFLIDAIELPAFPLVIERIGKQALAELGRVVRQMKRARTKRDGPAFRRLTAATHEMMFRPVGYPRLERFVTILVGPVGLRYDRVFVDNFADTWDLMLELAVGRYEYIRDGDAEGAADLVRHCRDQIGALNRSRYNDNMVAPYFRPPE